MTDEMVGKYIKLLCLQHQHGSIKKDHFEAIVGTSDLIREKFIENCDGWYNERLRAEAERRNRYSESRKQNRVKHKSNICSTYVEHMETETEDSNKVVNVWLDKKYVESKFSLLWNEYPRRVKRKEALIHFRSSVKNEERYTLITKALENYMASVIDKEPQYIQVGSTWFNNWEDWIKDPHTNPAEDKALKDKQRKIKEMYKKRGLYVT